MMARRKRRATSMSSNPEDGGLDSVASSPVPEQPKNKKAKFEVRYKTDETSDADVLGESCYLPINEVILTSRNHSQADQNLVLACIRTFQNSNN